MILQKEQVKSIRTGGDQVIEALAGALGVHLLERSRVDGNAGGREDGRHVGDGGRLVTAEHGEQVSGNVTHDWRSGAEMGQGGKTRDGVSFACRLKRGIEDGRCTASSAYGHCKIQQQTDEEKGAAARAYFENM